MATLDNPGATYGMCQAVTAAVEERVRQDAKWGYHFPGRTHDRWLAILVEEVGEAAEAILQADNPNGDEKAEQSLDDVRREVVQIAAVALSWLEHGEWEGSREQAGAAVQGSPPLLGKVLLRLHAAFYGEGQ